MTANMLLPESKWHCVTGVRRQQIDRCDHDDCWNYRSGCHVYGCGEEQSVENVNEEGDAIG